MVSTIVPSLSAPKRPHDGVALSELEEDFQKCPDNKVSRCNSSIACSYTIMNLAIPYSGFWL